jgi:hypothetical protein
LALADDEEADLAMTHLLDEYLLDFPPDLDPAAQEAEPIAQQLLDPALLQAGAIAQQAQPGPQEPMVDVLLSSAETFLDLTAEEREYWREEIAAFNGYAG